MANDRIARLAAALVAKHDFEHALGVLNREGIIPMPLKGILLQQSVYRDPADRVISDTDLLVPPGHFIRALKALKRASYRVSPVGRAAAATRSASGRLEVDVHGRLFSPGLYGLDTGAIFDRARLDEQLFQATVMIPAPLDLYAHLVGNFAKGRHGSTHKNQLRDFAAVARHHELDAGAVARHLEDHGLSRAALFTLPLVIETQEDHFARAVLQALPRDRVGILCAQAARGLEKRFGGEARLSLLSPHLVNRTLPRGLRSLTAHVGLGARSRLVSAWRRRQRPTPDLSRD